MKNEKLTALTFDDGPSVTTTSQLLDVLKKHEVTASFFVCGNNITSESAEVMRRAAEYGCEIHNHSRTHSDMTKMTGSEIVDEIKFTSDKVESVTGKPPRFFRPPYIAVNELMQEVVDLTFICGVGAEDYKDEISAEERCRRISDRISDGTVILLHDTEGNFRTVEAVDMLIPKLKAQGYRFVTISGLFEENKIIPKRGIIYTNVFQTE